MKTPLNIFSQKTQRGCFLSHVMQKNTQHFISLAFGQNLKSQFGIFRIFFSSKIHTIGQSKRVGVILQIMVQAKVVKITYDVDG